MNASISKSLRVLASGVALAIVAAFSGAASADALLCSAVSQGQEHAQGLAVGDVTFAGSDATDCWGVGATGGEANNPWVVGNWTLLVADASPGSGPDTTNNAGGVDFTLSTTGTDSGTWTLRWVDTGARDLPFSMDLVVVLSTGTSFASYLFDNRAFRMDGSGGGEFTLAIKDAGPLGSFAVYQTDLKELPRVTLQSVPEPGVLLLLGVGLVGLGATRLRRQRVR